MHAHVGGTKGSAFYLQLLHLSLQNFPKNGIQNFYAGIFVIYIFPHKVTKHRHFLVLGSVHMLKKIQIAVTFLRGPKCTFLNFQNFNLFSTGGIVISAIFRENI